MLPTLICEVCYFRKTKLLCMLYLMNILFMVYVPGCHKYIMSDTVKTVTKHAVFVFCPCSPAFCFVLKDNSVNVSV